MFPLLSRNQPQPEVPEQNPNLLRFPSAPVAPAPPPTEEEIAMQQAAAEEQQKQQDAEEQQIAEIVRELIRKAEDEDLDYRYNMVNIWKRNNLYFENVQNIVLDPVARDYRTVDAIMFELQKQQGAVFDIKINNIYRAFAESIIAAMSVDLPPVAFPPDDSENPDDIETSDAYTKIGVLVQRHNKAGLMLIKALTILYNQGTVFAHNLYKEDPNYGVVRTPSKVEQKKIDLVDAVCPQCHESIESGLPSSVILERSNVHCKNCNWTGSPVGRPTEDYVEEVTEYEDTPKGRSLFNIYGPLNVKVSIYAKDQDSIGYLILRNEENKYKLRAEFNNDDLEDLSDTISYERWGRLPIDYRGNLPVDVATKRTCWFRPWWFRRIENEEHRQLLDNKYPNGLVATIVGETIVDIKSDELDDRWTITFDPRSNYIHAEAAGNVMIPIQDAENDIFNLGIQCIEFGIPETFADPRTLNLQKYAQSSNAPGMITAAIPPRPDKNLSDGFHTVKVATLSNEYSTFDASLTTKGQFASGGLPSLWGGSVAKGDQTATEYTESRSQALQRLQIPWRMVKEFWGTLIYKCVRDYADHLKEDESYPEKSNGKYKSVWIRKTSLTGKVGQIEPEMSEQLPQSWNAKKQFITHLIELNIPEVGAILLHPNNSELIKQYTGIPSIYIPGENDRNKQWDEYYKLADGQPVSDQLPSIQVDIDVDDHQMEASVLKNILTSNLGLRLKEEKPLGYQNCILHYRQHILAQQAKTMSQSSGGSGNAPPTFAPVKE